MTLPDESRRAVKLTRQWLTELMNPRGHWKRIRDIRRAARVLLKHYPSGFDVDELFDLMEIQRRYGRVTSARAWVRTRA